MSMFNDVLGFGRSSVYESMMDDTIEPEIADMTLENAADIDEDPMDFMLRVAYENEMNMMNLDTAIIAEEYIYLRENGQEMVTEAGKIETIVSKAKEMLKKLWEKIQSFFKKVIKKIDEVLKLDQRFLDKYERKAAGNKATVKGDASLLKVKAIAIKGINMMNKIGESAEAEFNVATDNDNPSYSDNDEFMKKLMKDLGGADPDSPRDIMKSMIDGYKGDEDSKVTVDANQAISNFKDSKKCKEFLKNAYDTNKKNINGWLKGLKKLENSAKKFKIIPTEMSKEIHKSVKNLNKAGSVLTLVNRTFVHAINMSRNFCKAVIVQAAAKADPNKETNESASLIESFDLM